MKILFLHWVFPNFLELRHNSIILKSNPYVYTIVNMMDVYQELARISVTIGNSYSINRLHNVTLWFCTKQVEIK
jgi:hypothetical protein